MEGCTRQCADNCDYCAFHCESYNTPQDFNKNMGNDIDKQVKQYNDNRNKK